MLQQDEPDDYVIATGETHTRARVLRGRLRPRRPRLEEVRRRRSALLPPDRGRPAARRRDQGEARARLGADDEVRRARQADGRCGSRAPEERQARGRRCRRAARIFITGGAGFHRRRGCAARCVHVAISWSCRTSTCSTSSTSRRCATHLATSRAGRRRAPRGDQPRADVRATIRRSRSRPTSAAPPGCSRRCARAGRDGSLIFASTAQVYARRCARARRRDRRDPTRSRRRTSTRARSGPASS